MADLREFKNQIQETVKSVNEKASWKWTVKVLKSEIRLTNDYIKGQYEQDYFKIKADRSEEYVSGTDCMEDTFATMIVGKDRWSDGTLADCIQKAIRNAESYFSHCY